MNWSSDIEILLEQTRINCVYLTKFHKRRYFHYKQVATWIRLPTITISSIASVASVGLTHYLSQQNISGVVCLLSLLVSIINSIELYIKINENTEHELETSKKYYHLSIEINKVLKLDRPNRIINGLDALEKYSRDYSELYESSALLQNVYIDKLTTIPKTRSIFSTPPSSDSSINSNPLENQLEAEI